MIQRFLVPFGWLLWGVALAGCPSEPPEKSEGKELLSGGVSVDAGNTSISINKDAGIEGSSDSGPLDEHQEDAGSPSVPPAEERQDGGLGELVCPIVVGGFCDSDAQCDDGVSCSTDTCDEEGVCHHHLLSACSLGSCQSPYEVNLQPQARRKKIKVASDLMNEIALPGEFDGCPAAPFSEHMFFKMHLEHTGFVRFSVQNPVGPHQFFLKMATACAGNGNTGGAPGGGPPGNPGDTGFPSTDQQADAGVSTNMDGMAFFCQHWDPPPAGYRGGECREPQEQDGGIETHPLCEEGLECVSAQGDGWCVGPDVNCEYQYLGQKRTAAVHLQAGEYYLGVVQFEPGGTWWSFDAEIMAMSVVQLELFSTESGTMSFQQERNLVLTATFADNTNGFLPAAIATWTTSNPQVAILSDETPGFIKAGVPGTATITATYTDEYGGGSAIYEVTVE